MRTSSPQAENLKTTYAKAIERFDNEVKREGRRYKRIIRYMRPAEDWLRLRTR